MKCVLRACVCMRGFVCAMLQQVHSKLFRSGATTTKAGYIVVGCKSVQQVLVCWMNYAGGLCAWLCASAAGFEPLVATSIHAATLSVQRDVAQSVGGVGVLVLAAHGKGECCCAGVAEVLAAS